MELTGTENATTDVLTLPTGEMKNLSGKLVKELLDNFGEELSADSAIEALHSGDNMALFGVCSAAAASTRYGLKDYLAGQLSGTSIAAAAGASTGVANGSASGASTGGAAPAGGDESELGGQQHFMY